MPQLNLMYPRPVGWEAPYKYGGNCMCEITGGFISNVGQYITLDGNCASQSIEVLYTNTFQSLAALLFTTPNLTSPNLCNHELQDPAACRRFISAALPFIGGHISPVDLQATRVIVAQVKSQIQTTIRPQLMQYLYYPSQNNLIIAHIDLLDGSNFEYFSWLYLIDWVNSYREVVRFEGALNNMTLVTGTMLGQRTKPNPQEVPINVAFYIRSALQYMTYVLIGVAGMVCFSIFVNRGRIEGWNMFEFNRVAGVVWIGRPLMVLRGVTAICLLSTEMLVLTRPFNGISTQFVHTQPDWLTTLLSSGEMGWLVYVLNDVFSVATRQFTTGYAMKSTLLGYLGAAIWSFTVPVHHFVTIDRQCTILVVDFQLECHSGTVAIGRFDRFCGLLLLAAGCCVVAFFLERVFARGVVQYHSYLLHSSARYHFEQAEWVVDGTYHLDRASAVLNGLVVVPIRGNRIVALDIKSWRVMVLEINRVDTVRSKSVHLQHTIPLGN
ncbi:Aste57867_5337 [Aphanomyces stellatus]|uniref:Aste57867_5337 protein n=1 Tax=Aphanomyces stellatus TaxID=120398 RepID=A0A485KEH4_9STRA|nr:hypothetical protein As57867_005324 [Aphanomyces stellatus]VFT82400.1 Aste57867_5337 [Aphanomyces stellatus]